MNSDQFIAQTNNSLAHASSIIKETNGQPNSHIRVVESEEELRGICQQLVADSDSVVLLQAYEHGLRSYRPFQCWLLLTVLKAQNGVQSFLIDAVRYKDSIGATVGAVCKATSILKVIESQNILEKLYTEFNCYTLNVVLAQRPIESTNCYSTILIEQDYRIRPLG